MGHHPTELEVGVRVIGYENDADGCANWGHKACHKGGHPFAVFADYPGDSCDDTAWYS